MSETPKNCKSSTDTDKLKSLQIFAMHRNGINISKVRINGLFKVDALDISIFQTRILRIMNIAVGYIVTEINNINLLQYDNIFAATLLASTNIVSIIVYSPVEYTKLQRQSNYRKKDKNTCNSSQSIINPIILATSTIIVSTPGTENLNNNSGSHNARNEINSSNQSTVANK